MSKLTPTQRVIVYACRSSYTAEVAEIIWRRGAEIHALVDNMPGSPEMSPLGRVMLPGELTSAERELPVVIPLTTPGHRVVVEREARALGLTRFPALIDPTAVIARTARLGEGVSVNALAVVGAGSQLGRFSLVNRSTSVGHDVELHDFVTIGPGCILAGHVVIESGVFIGTGAVLAPKVRIGANAIVGAGAVVVRDVPPFATVVGNPARVLRQSTTGYNKASVDIDALTLDPEAAQ